MRSIAELRKEIAAYRRRSPEGQAVGFVPTMGYLHEGHASLLRRSSAENGLTVLSVFVNPLQFGPNEDLDKYPRDEARDLAVASASGADIVFMPEVREMYPERMLTAVSVSGVTERLCGASRPGHFDGVATVVTKLLNIVQPDRAYFGQKDAQQVAVIERMVKDLNIPVDVIACPTQREKDGLALSSRNFYLNADERRQALILSRSLAQVPLLIREGACAERLIHWLSSEIAAQPLADIDYIDVFSYPDLQPLAADEPLRSTSAPVLVALAVRFGKTRLIDNMLLNPAEVH
ncbi:pantoate--beta-alanine ligase [Cohnella kolymensis]|uniref:Pantothenate synthetase n=1 Tax=Cohnella kolymensis TaxID=1590652 RepID=A0ABR5A1V5_9BACL|nr:pantoate--beta-alanine ligase [Cohnella kolymensis]